MLIKEFDKKTDRWQVFGVGRVISRSGQDALTKKIVSRPDRTVRRIGFSICTAIKSKGDGNKTFQTVPCAIYWNFTSKDLFAVAEDLKTGDLVQFAGWIKQSPFNDAITGEQKISTECRVEWLLPIKYFACGSNKPPEAVDGNGFVLKKPDDESDDFWDDELKGE